MTGATGPTDQPGDGGGSGDPVLRAHAAIDHLVYAVPDLDAAVAQFAEQTGVVAAPGGRHVGRGTHNALVGLGGTTYLEIIGPDASQDLPAGTTLPFGVEQLDAPRLIWFAVATDQLVDTVQRLRAGGFEAGEPFEMQRARPDGVLLHWILSTLSEVPEGGTLPFLIDWLDSPHPSADSPQGCTLQRLLITHPEPDRVRRYLDLVRAPLPVEEGPAGLVAVLDTPKGTFELR